MADHSGGGESLEDKLSSFQAATGLTDPDLCTDILSAHNWDLNLAISTITSNPNPNPPSLAWKLITLPFSAASSALGLGLWIATGVLSRLLPPESASSGEAAAFVTSFDGDFPALPRPNFVAEGFTEALQRSQREFKMMFVYLHSPDHPDAPEFCLRCLCSEAVAGFVNENFVAWGGSVRGSEGFKMSNTLKASRFPFCAVVMASVNQKIELLAQMEGPQTPEEMLATLQRIFEERSPSLVAARLEAEERITNMRLREEQDAAYRAALEADQARERQRKEEQERSEREAAEAERKLKEEKEVMERAAQEAAERQAALVKRRREKAMALGEEPAKGPDITQVLVRFPNGERKERRFHCNATVESLYNYVDSLDCLNAEKYNLVSNFPRIVYGPEKHSQLLKEAGLHPRASLFVEIDS